MPFKMDTGKRESEEYCSLCYKDGDFVYKGNDMKEFQDICRKEMIEKGMNPGLAHLFTFVTRFAPRWRKK